LSRPPRPPSARPRASGLRRWAGVAALLAGGCIALGGCGSSGGSGTTADPATAVPATAAVYAGAEVRPSGAEKTSALAVGHSLTHQNNPYPRLVEALQTPGSPHLDYGHDVAPWLGPHAGVFLSSLSGAAALAPLLTQGLLGSGASAAPFPFGNHGAQGAIVMDTSDSAKARSFVEGQAAHAGAHAVTYRGVSYQVSADGVAFAIVARLAVIGSEAGVHGVIDTTLGAPALTHAAGYAKLAAAAPAGTLAHVYVNPTAQEGAQASNGGSATGVLALLGAGRQSNISLVPASGSLSVSLDATAAASTGTPGGLLAAAAEGSRAFDELPGDSWLGIGLAHLGGNLGQDVVGLRELSSLGAGLTGASSGAAAAGPLSLKGLVEGLLAPLSVLGANTPQAKHDFASWMGSGGVFASGSGLLELKGAVVIESTNPTLSRAAVAKLAAQLSRRGTTTQTASIPGTDAAVTARVSGLPVTLVIANGRDAAGTTKFVLGLGEASITAALSPSSTLASAASRATAASGLGEGIQPSLLLEVPVLLGLLEGVGLTEDPTISKVLPYLRAVTTIAGGGHELSEGVERFKLRIGLR
jgi:hypothetical protein